jgi:hypothetical protein
LSPSWVGSVSIIEEGNASPTILCHAS